MTATGKYLRIALGVAIIAALIIVPMNFNRYGLYILSQWAVMTIAAMGLNLTLGYAGQVSLAQGAFVGIGAYAAAIMTTQGMPLIAALGVAIVLCFAIGWILGYPALRVQHHYLAFVTLAFSTLLYLVFRNEEWITGGIYGISNIPRPSLFGYLLRTPRDFYYFCLANLTLVSLAAWWLIRSPWGRAFVALRENPLRALSLGVDTRRYTLMAFALGAGLGGISGVLYAPLVQYIDPTPFSLLLSLNLLLMVIVGGSGYFFGPFVGAVVAVLLPEWLQSADKLYDALGPLSDVLRTLLPPAALKYVAKHYLVAYAIFVMLLLVFSPSGIIGFFEKRFTARKVEPPAPASQVKVA
jgi:branched-chain amino acid transport system permease protein